MMGRGCKTRDKAAAAEGGAVGQEGGEGGEREGSRAFRELEGDCAKVDVGWLDWARGGREGRAGTLWPRCCGGGLTEMRDREGEERMRIRDRRG